MPVNIPDSLPAADILRNENIFVMSESRASHQDIRPLRIAILNLMPIKQKTETHLLRMLSNSPLQVEITFLCTESHIPKNTNLEHLQTFYRYFSDIKHKRFDGLIITGAPIEHLEFEDVRYWSELTAIYDWAQTNVTSTLNICWGAQAALYYCFGINKYTYEDQSKMFGVFKHRLVNKQLPLVQGFDEEFFAPHSRYTYNKAEDIIAHPELELVSVSDQAGVYIVKSKNGKMIMVTGHSEYEPNTLKEEYLRDKEKGINTPLPQNYFQNNDPTQDPVNRWKAHGNLLFSNWLNYYVYQATPYEI